MDVHLRELRAFLAVAEHLHFTRAAEALFISQPALSKQIRALETQLRTPLFERDRREVRLTAAGTALLAASRPVLDAWRHAEAEVARAASEQARTLTLGLSTGVGRGLLPAVHARFADAVPPARVQVRQFSWHDPTAGLGDGAATRTDAALVWLPLPRAERFAWEAVATEPCVLALPTRHPLADNQAIDIGELLDEPFLVLPPASGALREFWLGTDARHGHPVTVGAEIATTDETLEALGAGLGVCFIAAGNAPLYRAAGMITRPVTGIGPSQLVLAWRRDDNRPLVTLLRDTVREVVATQQPR